jgi:exonuclease SbcC
MKPIHLSITGLRSYRETVEIDFPTGGGLLAIVGDTGSGKSSILEAIVYALFSSPTWAGDDVKELIADNEPEMRVAFTFEVDGVRWLVKRAHKQNTTRSSHKLENLTTPGEPIDDAREVTARIEHILGFDRDTFLSAVILPQGRFSRLLTATDKRRTDILSAILRLGELEEVWRLCDGALDKLQPLIEATTVARARLGDPEAEAAAAQKQLAAAKRRYRELQTVVQRRQEVLAGADAARQHVADYNTSATAIRGCLNGCAERMAVLATLETALSTEREALEQARNTAGLAAQAAADELKQADNAGVGLAGLAVAETALGFLLTEVPRLADLALNLDQRDQQLAETRESLAVAHTTHEALVASLATTQAANGKAEQAVSAAAQRLQAARDAFRAATQMHKEELAAEAGVTQAEAKIPVFEQAAQHAVEQAEKAVAKDLAGSGALHEAERADHAAACAHGLSAGSQCPVCGTTLPKGFRPPHASAGLAGLRKTAEAATGERRTAEAAVTAAATELQGARELVRTRLEEAARRRTEASVAVSTLKDLVADVDLSASEDMALSVPISEEGKAVTAATAAAADYEAVRGAHDRSAAQLKAGRQSLDERAAHLASDRAEYDRCTNIAGQRRAVLPPTYRPEADAAATEMNAVLNRLTERKAALAMVEAERQAQEQRRQEAASGLDALAARGVRELDRPATVEWGVACTLHASVSTATSLVGTTSPAVLDATALIAERAVQVAALEASAHDTLGALGRKVAAAQGVVDAAEEEAAAVLSKADIASPEVLTAYVEEALKQVGAEERAEANALVKIEPARTLMEVTRPFEERVNALRDIKETMTSATFVAEVRRRREAHLLRAASQILLGLSSGRYEFVGQSKDPTEQHKQFVIYDHVTGQERPPQTLSGGETFLASLALALGLSEIVDRRDHRLEALFLDEGFGSLDESSLDDAVAALEKAGAGGRLVTVVTHLSRVMHAIDQVLAVVRRPTGSQVRWLGATERARAEEQEATAGLLV